MPLFAPCLYEEADTRIFARALEAAKMPNKKISSRTVDTDVVVLVIPVVQQFKALGTLDRHAHHLNYPGGQKSPPQFFLVLTNLNCFDLGTSLKKVMF